MILKQWDIVKSIEQSNKSEALVDLVIWGTVYITPRWKMSLSYPERYLISKNKLIKCEKNTGKYIFTKEQIAKDWYALTWEIIYKFNDVQLDTLQTWDIIKFNWTTLLFIEFVDWVWVFNKGGYAYSLDQDELNTLTHNDRAIVHKLYWEDINNYEIIDEDELSDDEIKKPEFKVPEEVRLPF